MQFDAVVESIGTVTDLKRVASAYVIDYRALSESELRAALCKTAPQYFHDANVSAALHCMMAGDDRSERILTRLILLEVMLNRDDFICPKRDTEDEVVAWEHSIIDRANEDLAMKNSHRRDNIEMLRFVVETAWRNNDSISRDEFNLISKLCERLRINRRRASNHRGAVRQIPNGGQQSPQSK